MEQEDTHLEFPGSVQIFLKMDGISAKMDEMVTTIRGRFIDKEIMLCYNSVNPYSGGIADAAKGDSGRLDV